MVPGRPYMIDLRRWLAARARFAVEDSPPAARVAYKDGVADSTPVRGQRDRTPTRVHKGSPNGV
jgi:hypothetical protein